MYMQTFVTKCQNSAENYKFVPKITENGPNFCRFRQKYLTLFFLFTFRGAQIKDEACMGKEKFSTSELKKNISMTD